MPAADGALAQALAKAREGDVLELEPGIHRGNVVLDKRLTLRGAGAVLDGGGKGRVLTVAAADAVVEGLELRASGTDVGVPDACVFVTEKAERAALRRLKLSQCAFGIWADATPRVEISECDIRGSLEGQRSERGNAIHLFDVSHGLVRGNRVVGGRDAIYLGATDDTTIENNELRQARYGIHWMYSHRNTVRGNRAIGNTSGFAIMLSSHITAIDNLAEGNEEHGILFRDVQQCFIQRNRSLKNAMGFFFYGSTGNVVSQNLVRDNALGIKIWAGSVRNEISQNSVIGNRTQVFYVSTQDLVLGQTSKGNYWGDYTGWDQNGDGIGDRPYRVDSFTNDLIHRYPAAVLLLRSPSLELLAHLEQRLPLLRVPTLIDLRPLTRAEVW